MAFFVLDKDVASGLVRLPIDGTYGTPEEALGALSAAVGSGAATVSGQVYVVDLDSALPVLVMPTPVAPPVATAEAQVSELVDDRDSGLIADAPVFTDEPVEDSLADALKRAATSLEGEGVIAPESIGAEDFSFIEEFTPDEAPVEAPVLAEQIQHEVPAPLEESTPADVVEPMSAQVEQSPEVLEAPADWPWANVEAFAPTAEEVPHETPSVVESLGESDTLITSAPPLGEEAYVPRPVILGDYADQVAPVAVDAPETEESEAIDEPRVTDEPEAIDELETIEEPRAIEEPAVEMVYEPTGALDLEAYSCHDCVYSNTCPKVGTITPAECGTFQWRSA